MSLSDRRLLRWTASPIAGYVVAVVAVAAALWLRHLLDPAVGDRYPFVTVYFAILFCSARYGIGPGLAATVIGFVAGSHLFVNPRYQFTLWEDTDPFTPVLRLVTAATVVGMVALWYSPRRRADDNRRQVR